MSKRTSLDDRLRDALINYWKGKNLFIELANDETADNTDRGAAILICQQNGWDWQAYRSSNRKTSKARKSQ